VTARLWPQAAAGVEVTTFPAPPRSVRALPSASSLQAVANGVLRSLTAEQECWFAWYVVAFGAGIAIYFELQTEPGDVMACVVGLAALACGLRGSKSDSAGLRFLCALIAAAGLGFAAAKIRTDRVAAPVISREIGPLNITGRIQSIDIEAPNKARVILAPEKLGAGTNTTLPATVRLTLTGAKAVEAAKPGAVVTAVAILRPPPEPAMPNGYDFARWAYFQRIGGVGFTYGAPKPVEAPSPPTLFDRIRAGVEHLRLTMSARIRRAIPGPDGTVAAALITAERGAISEDDQQAYRDSGLAHVLSISGVHLALAGLGIFWAFRALMALSPRLALTQPIKKWAAVVAFMSASFYLLISGGGPPAVRSYLMLSAMLLGVIADRPASVDARGGHGGPRHSRLQSRGYCQSKLPDVVCRRHRLDRARRMGRVAPTG
jgi:competence protein ComEC